MNIVERVSFFLLICCALIFSSCAGMNADRARDEKTSADISREISAEAKREVAAGSFSRALAVYSAAFRQYPGNENIRDGYIRTAEEMKTAADKAFRKGSASAAGRMYSSLLKSGIRTDLGASLSFDAGHLTRLLQKCKNVLHLAAMKAYRKGDIESALSDWKKILAFDPDDSEARKAVNTATVQLRNFRAAD